MSGGWGSYDPAPNDGRPDPSSWADPAGGSNERAHPTSALPPVGGYQAPGVNEQPGAYQPGAYQPGGYQPAGAYPQSGGYQPPSYPQPGGYAPAPGHQPPPGYAPLGAYPQSAAYGGAASTSRAPGMTGTAVAGVGAVIAVLGLFLNWYAVGQSHAGLKDLVQATKAPNAPGLFHLYFGWALWVVLAAAIAVAIAANLARTSVVLLAVGGAAVAVLSSVLTFAALNSGRASGSPFDHAAVGLWLFLLGPLVLAAGALTALTRPAR